MMYPGFRLAPMARQAPVPSSWGLAIGGIQGREQLSPYLELACQGDHPDHRLDRVDVAAPRHCRRRHGRAGRPGHLYPSFMRNRPSVPRAMSVSGRVDEFQASAGVTVFVLPGCVAEIQAVRRWQDLRAGQDGDRATIAQHRLAGLGDDGALSLTSKTPLRVPALGAVRTCTAKKPCPGWRHPAPARWWSLVMTGAKSVPESTPRPLLASAGLSPSTGMRHERPPFRSGSPGCSRWPGCCGTSRRCIAAHATGGDVDHAVHAESPRGVRRWQVQAGGQVQRRLTGPAGTESCVLMVCALAWYTRCAVIMSTSSAVPVDALADSGRGLQRRGCRRRRPGQGLPTPRFPAHWLLPVRLQALRVGEIRQHDSRP